MCLRFIGQFNPDQANIECQKQQAVIPLPVTQKANDDYRQAFDSLGQNKKVLIDLNDEERQRIFL